MSHPEFHQDAFGVLPNLRLQPQTRLDLGPFAVATTDGVLFEELAVEFRKEIEPHLDAFRNQTGETYRPMTLAFLKIEEDEKVGWPGGISPPGSHRTVRDSLPSYGSCRSDHLRAGFTQTQ